MSIYRHIPPEFLEFADFPRPLSADLRRARHGGSLVVPQGQIAVFKIHWEASYMNAMKRPCYQVFEAGQEAPLPPDNTGALELLKEGEFTALFPCIRGLGLDQGHFTTIYVINQGGRAKMLSDHPAEKLSREERLQAFKTAIIKTAGVSNNWQWNDTFASQLQAIACFAKGYLFSNITIPGVGALHFPVWVEMDAEGHLFYSFMYPALLWTFFSHESQEEDERRQQEIKEAAWACTESGAIRPLGLEWVVRDALIRNIKHEDRTEAWRAREREIFALSLKDLRELYARL